MLSRSVPSAASIERAMRSGAAYEAVPRGLADVVRVLGAPPAPTRAELVPRLVEEGLAEPEARAAVALAERLGLVREGPDRRCWLARGVPFTRN